MVYERTGTQRRRFIQLFEQNNLYCTSTEVCFVDEDFAQSDVLREEHMTIPTCICAFHTVKTMKSHISTEKFEVYDKQILLTCFWWVIYSKIFEEYTFHEKVLVRIRSSFLQAYYQN